MWQEDILALALGLGIAWSCISPSGAYASVPPPDHPFRVVIDPGHGGSDEGTVFEGRFGTVKEKDATLLLAQQVARELRARGMIVILTRTRDIDVPLGLRTSMANRLDANVFLSIHMNSSHEAAPLSPEGVETYILNNTTDATSRRLAKLENTVLGPAESDSPRPLDVSLILRDLRLDANLSESKRLACAIQKNLVSSSRLVSGRPLAPRNRGVKQALFHVLLGAEMPSVLVEAGFLTHPLDRALVLSPRRRQAMADGIARAVLDFRDLRGTSRALNTLSKCKIH